MRRALKWALMAAIGVVPVGADAAIYGFDFSTTDSVFTVTGTITTADTLDAIGGFDVLSISGTIFGPGGGTIALEPNSSQHFPDYNGIFQYDNVFYPNATTEVDGYGLLFSAGGYDYNLYSFGPTYYLSSYTNPAGAFDPGQPVAFGDPINAATSAPEPSTWALMLLGFAGLGLAGGLKGRRNVAVLSASPVQRGRRA